MSTRLTDEVYSPEEGVIIAPGKSPAADRNPAASDRKKTALRGGSWTLVGYIATQVLRTLATILVARYFLGPEAFGVVGLVGVFLTGLAMFSELGIVANVVQHPRGGEPAFLATAYSIQGARGFAIWIIAMLAAYPLSKFYGQPELLPLLIVAGFAEFIRALASTSICSFTREVQLKKVTILTIVSEFVGFAACLGTAALWPSAWALVGRSLATAAVYAIGSHFLRKPFILPRWDKSAAKEILNFGSWVSISTAAYFLSGQSERLILGKFTTAAELGCFSLALMISSMPAGGVSQLVNQIYLPLISKSVRSSPEEAMRDFGKARAGFMLLGLVAGLGFLFLGTPVVNLALSKEYAMTGWMLEALGIRVALDVFSAPATSLLLAYGKSKYSAVASSLRLVLMIAGIWIGFTKAGLSGAIVSLIVAQMLSYFPVIVGLRTLYPAAARKEIAWYLSFTAILSLAAAAMWVKH